MKSIAMKRITSLAAAALVAGTALAVPASAAPGKTNLGSIPKADASKITVDGKKDALYDKGLKIATKENAAGVSATAWLLWSDGYIYVYADVADAKRDDGKQQATSPWTSDSFELFVDDDNDGKNYGMQYRVDYTGYGTWKDRNANKNYYTPDVLGSDFKFGAVNSASGYTAEMRVPMKAVEGKQVGLNIQINGISGTSYLVKDGWNTPEYPYALLGAKLPEEKPAAKPTAAATADPIAIAALAALASGLVIRKRK